MPEIKKKKEKKMESKVTENVTDKELETLKEDLFSDIVSVESIKTGRKGREPKYAKLAAAIKIVAKMSRNAYRLNLEKVFQLENYSKLDLKERKALVRKVYPILDRYLKEFASTHGYDLSKKEVKKNREGNEIIIKGVKIATLPEYAKFKKETISMRLVGSDVYLIKQSDVPIE
jgi:predicted DNA binding CopG/RHH family protein